MKTKTLLVLLATLCCGLTFAGENRITVPTTYTIGNDTGDALINMVQVSDKADLPDYTPLLGITIDVLQWRIDSPFNACDNIRECADAVDDGCQISDQGVGASAAIDLETKTCAGKCSNGAAVEVVCATPNTIIDEADPTADEPRPMLEG